MGIHVRVGERERDPNGIVIRQIPGSREGGGARQIPGRRDEVRQIPGGRGPVVVAPPILRPTPVFIPSQPAVIVERPRQVVVRRETCCEALLRILKIIFCFWC